MDRKRPLTVAQTRTLLELSEPNRNPSNVWYFPQKDLRTLRVLAERGFARSEIPSPSGYANRYGFSITPRGSDEFRRLGLLPPAFGGHGG